MNTQNIIDEKFDMEFGKFYLSETEVDKEGAQIVASEDIKSFIQKALTAQRQEFVDMLKGMDVFEGMNTSDVRRWRKERDDLIQQLSE